ncbi:hypothetical protein DM01DRAFT_1362583 [Hesseltinella vesiculosa]|uniref:G-protein coupled receptors family 2 profile 2 domain-containing protein n=1 Tax=Hesseltinella vesiculosa TaxID=101127 RepID=A0A1X2GK03_9FUNG|nr:hypothetical protein DM01DRAFT_1362583 [Hesseltinella vesiculosa]
MYSPDEYEILAEACSVACISIISTLFGRKLTSYDNKFYYIRTLLLLLYTLSWIITLIGCMLTSTNNGNTVSCSFSFFNMSLIYTVTKILLYLYWTEKLYLTSMTKTSRLRSFLYNFNIIALIPYVGIIVLMIYYRVVYVAEAAPYHCWIGYKWPASITAMAYETVIILMFTAMFAKAYYYPTQDQQASQHAMSISITSQRNMIIGLVALVTSGLKYALSIAYQDGLRGLILTCVTSLDVTIVCIVIHWVTAHPAETQFMERILPQQSSSDKPIKLEIKQHQEVVVLTELNSKV